MAFSPTLMYYSFVWIRSKYSLHMRHVFGLTLCCYIDPSQSGQLSLALGS